MSTSYIGSDALTAPITPLTVPGFDVLDPASYAESANGSTASSGSTSSSSGSSAPDSSTSPAAASAAQNPYQQAVATLAQWQYQTLTQSLTGDTSNASAALYATAGLSVDQFAALASQLQNLGSATTGSTVDTTA
ncbi:MAG TPA: hypothetical protein VMF11_15735 [Candidatus Baltobacteraceae bacterium]|nr:hypothetical protein [Candidatus Baltobacteraceae bacterium]